MSSKGALDVYINSLPENIRYAVRSALYFLSDNFRLGDSAKAENALWYAVEATTPAVANTELVVPHQMSSIPARFIPVVRLSEVNNQLINLKVSRAADAVNVYFKSASTSAVFSGYFE